ncbi:DUF6933 domain-containing protein [Virgibacillus sp. DJP39]|uniref:DUF6933 domain-containing protein n=1 Tax=Virgibacillus sp. DJP39 TaxID=3409790 RepID=UPI003BB57E62
MNVQCTKKLLDLSRVKPTESVEEEPVFSWHANVITLKSNLVPVTSRYLSNGVE